MKISEQEIKRIASPTIYKRGLEYYKDGRVHIKSREEQKIVALVDGEDIYSVSINFDGEKIKDGFCTCPYYRTMDSVCKHIVATLKKRQAELLEGENYKDENDKLAQNLCSEFLDNCFEKPRLAMSFTLNIAAAADRRCRYSIEMKCGFEELKRIESIDRFLYSYINAEDFKISKHKAINSSKYSLSAADEEIVNILCEAYLNKTNDDIYNPRISRFDISAPSAKRLLPYLINADVSFTFNALPLNDIRIVDENPDILVDVNATDTEINLTVTENGTALFDDGSWFLYENCLYKTDEEWQSWFMPIYRALMYESRTQIDFKGDMRVDFATYVYPKLRNKQGVVTAGLESMLINEKPRFSVYLDANNGYITAVVKVSYGAIDIHYPNANVRSDKIIIRDSEKEAELISFFANFVPDGNSYFLNDDDVIYDFITVGILDVRKLAKVYTSENFDRIYSKRDTNVKTKVSYDSKINLLEIDFDTSLSADEINEILNAVRLKNKYYKFSDGSYLSLEGDNTEQFRILDNLKFSKSEIKDRSKNISVYNLLYLDALKNEGIIDADDEFSKFIENIKNIKADIPSYLENVLRPYQKIGVNWLKQLSELGMGGILADDMGLGKTLEVIAFVMSEKRTLPALVVAPSTLTYNWVNEIKKFAPDAKAVIVEGTSAEREAVLADISGYDFVITSYPLLRRDYNMYSDIEFSYMFIDEAQYIKNSDTINAKAVKKINAKRKFALSGTPIENGLSELWSVFDFVMKGYLYSKKEFLSIFDKGNEPDSFAIKELRKKIKPFVLRRMKKDVLKELPEKIENTVYSEMLTEQRNMYEAFWKSAKCEVPSLVKQMGGGMRILTILLRLRQICCHPSLFDTNYKKDSGKLQLLCEIVESATSQGHRILIFSQFTSMLEIIRKRLEQMGKDCFYIDGQTPSIDRNEMAKRFNNGEKELFLISLKAGGTGLNLIGADTVIHYDPWWNPAVMDQASDRAYRIGQTKAVQVIRLATRGTIEEQILKLQESKRNLADSIIRKNEKTFSGFTKEEIISFFQT